MQVIDSSAFMDGDDVGVIEGRSGLGLSFKSKQAGLIACIPWRQNLYSDLALEGHIYRQIDPTHSTGCQQRDDLVVAHGSARHECHCAVGQFLRYFDDTLL